MNQQKIPFSKSINPSPQQIYASELEHKFKIENKNRRLSNVPQLTLDDFVKLRYGMTLYQYMNRPFSRLKFYKKNGWYNNGIRG